MVVFLALACLAGQTPPAAVESRFRRMDRDGDGFVTANEAPQGRGHARRRRASLRAARHPGSPPTTATATAGSAPRNMRPARARPCCGRASPAARADPRPARLTVPRPAARGALSLPERQNDRNPPRRAVHRQCHRRHHRRLRRRLPRARGADQGHDAADRRRGGDPALRPYGPGARDQRRLGRQHRGRRRGARRQGRLRRPGRARPARRVLPSTISPRPASSSPPRRAISACRPRARWCWSRPTRTGR